MRKQNKTLKISGFLWKPQSNYFWPIEADGQAQPVNAKTTREIGFLDINYSLLVFSHQFIRVFLIIAPPHENIAPPHYGIFTVIGGGGYRLSDH